MSVVHCHTAAWQLQAYAADLCGSRRICLMMTSTTAASIIRRACERRVFAFRLIVAAAPRPFLFDSSCIGRHWQERPIDTAQRARIRLPSKLPHPSTASRTETSRTPFAFTRAGRRIATASCASAYGDAVRQLWVWPWAHTVANGTKRTHGTPSNRRRQRLHCPLHPHRHIRVIRFSKVGGARVVRSGCAGVGALVCGGVREWLCVFGVDK